MNVRLSKRDKSENNHERKHEESNPNAHQSKGAPTDGEPAKTDERRDAENAKVDVNMARPKSKNHANDTADSSNEKKDSNDL